MATEFDQLIRELKAVRQKRRLTLDALANCSALLDALGRPSLQESLGAPCFRRKDLGEDERAIALRNATAIDIRTPGNLTDRRATLSLASGRNVKTTANYPGNVVAIMEGDLQRVVGRNCGPTVIRRISARRLSLAWSVSTAPTWAASSEVSGT